MRRFRSDADRRESAPTVHLPPLFLCSWTTLRRMRMRGVQESERMILFHAFIPGPVRGGKNKVGMTRTGHRYPLPHFVKWRNEAMPYVMGRCRRIEAPVKGTFIYVP